ncbi:MAG TPA: histidine phosphatase family protein [Solirubrobacteraceae bacterium]|jgi:phosphohistidine phosphatase
MGDAKHLLLLRHAKSSWDDPAVADHDRPLAARGHKAAKLIGARLRTDQTPISLVLCSSARRARETLDLVAPPGKIEIEDGLYGASADELLQRVRRVPDEFKSVMLVGHNPAIHDLAVELLSNAGELAVAKFPTGALATLTFTGSWGALAPRRAELVAFVKPRELG